MNIKKMFISLIALLPSSHKMSISTFNPFSLSKVAEYSQAANKIQEVVDYAESRFRHILTYVNNDPSKSDTNQKYWIQTLLLRELVVIYDLNSFKLVNANCILRNSFCL